MATLCALLTSKSSSSSSSLDPKISLISSPAPPVGLKCSKYAIRNQQSSFCWQTIFQHTSSQTVYNDKNCIEGCGLKSRKVA